MSIPPPVVRAQSLPLLSFLGHAEDLHAVLSTHSDFADLPQKLVDAEASLREEASALMQRRDKRMKVEALSRGSAEQQASLLRLAHRMHAAEVGLASTIDRARTALDAADAAAASARHVPAASAIVEYAERVSHSNAAPSSQVAFDGAAATGFRQGWGTPTPLQGMVHASYFATLGDKLLTAGGPGKAAADDVPPADALPVVDPQAPAFKAVAPRADAADAAERAPVSLGFGDSDDDSDSDEFG